ncbi:hypothetical protein CKY01_05260 [Photorhabdus laumondii subsp. clarkei]|uniref:Bacteriocin immunity protein n=1 Tax=Photorhabdus laumondii subsp. clarkei TaxID=2029685 RepID=A0A329VJG3_9GAMM|nr:hypothetical protein CKY01_05260 [Photorhabdus laumondii subsp. clarkei]
MCLTWGVSWLAHWIEYQNTASGGDLIFYPEEGIEDNPEGVLKVIKEWRARRDKPGFKNSGLKRPIGSSFL